MTLSPLAIKIVKASAGGIVSLPYHNSLAMNNATREAESHGLIQSILDDDQPTSIVTDAGRAFLTTLKDET